MVSLLRLLLEFSLFFPGAQAFEALKKLPSLRPRSCKIGCAQ